MWYKRPNPLFEVRSQNCAQWLLTSSCPSVRPSVRMEQLGSHRTDFHEIWYFRICQNLSKNFNIHYKLKRISYTLHEDLCTFMIISRWILLRMRNVSDESCRENQNTFCVKYFFFENRTVYEIMWKNIAEPGRPQMTIWRMRIAYWITRATNTHSQYVVLHFRRNSGCTNVTHCYGISTLLVLSVTMYAGLYTLALVGNYCHCMQRRYCSFRR